MDSQFNILKCGKTEFTQFLRAPNAPYMNQAFDTLSKWAKGYIKFTIQLIVVLLKQ